MPAYSPSSILGFTIDSIDYLDSDVGVVPIRLLQAADDDQEDERDLEDSDYDDEESPYPEAL